MVPRCWILNGVSVNILVEYRHLEMFTHTRLDINFVKDHKYQQIHSILIVSGANTA